MLKRFFPFYKPYKGLTTVVLGSSFILALTDLVYPAATRYVIDDLVPQGVVSAILWFSFVLVIMYTIRAGLEFIVSYYGHVLGVNIQRDMRKTIFMHLQTLDIRFFDDTKTGQIMARIVNDLFDLSEVSHHFPEDIISSSVRLIGSLIIMSLIEWRLALIVFAIVPIIAGFTLHFRPKFRKAFKKNREKMAGINERIEESISGIRVVRAFGTEEHETNLFQQGNEEFRDSRVSSVYHIGVFQSGVGFLSNLGLVIVLCAGGIVALKGSISLGAYAAFALFVSRFFQPLQILVRSMEMFQEGAAGFRRFLEIMDTKPDIVDAPNAIELTKVNGEVIFDHVSFAYGENQETVLNNINLQVTPGETIAIVGPSGVGKTTLCSLIPRFYETKAGTIKIDGTDIKHVSLASLRDAVGLVQQDVFLFSGSIRENIAYSRLDASEQEIEEAARLANALDFIQELPEGMDTLVGERGVKLSGGQKQRIAIARMFLKNPAILILDEATSSLDTMSEIAIRDSLEKLSKGRTTFIIAHRLATIRHAHRILVLTDEGIVEEGNHDNLVELQGVYHELYEAQVQSLVV